MSIIAEFINPEHSLLKRDDLPGVTIQAKPDDVNYQFLIDEGISIQDYVHYVPTAVENEFSDRYPQCIPSGNTADRRIYGVFAGYYPNGDVAINSVGTGLVRVRSNETNLNRGDYVESNGDGTARKQTNRNVRNSTVGKITSLTSLTTYPDGSRLFPCTLHCG